MAKCTKGTRSDSSDSAVEPSRSGERQKAKTNRITAMSHPLRARILRVLFERGVMSPAQLSRELHAELVCGLLQKSNVWLVMHAVSDR